MIARAPRFLFALVAGLAGWLAGAAAWAGGPTTQARLEPAVRAEVGGLIQSLDDAEFATRRAAAERLQALAGRQKLAAGLAAEVHEALISPRISLEARNHLQALLATLPEVAAPVPAETVSLDEIDALLDQCRSESFALRENAARRLAWLLSSPRWASPMMTRLKERLADPKLDREDRRVLLALWHKARAAWLLGDSAQWELPPISPEQLAQWIDDLARPQGSTPHEARIRRQAAERELVCLLSRDEYRGDAEKLLRQRLEEPGGDSARRRLARVLDWTRPAMVAEYWSDHHNAAVQYLLVGVPQVPEGLPKATLFDRIDDQTAHCVSGNSLSPGDYRVGVAIPHPQKPDAIFHLVNLPTPRKRLAYDDLLQTDEAPRLRALSERTVADFLARGRHLSREEIFILAQLEPHAVSKFIGPYFKAIDGRALKGEPDYASSGTVEQAAICTLLIAQLTHEAVPALEQAAGEASWSEPSELTSHCHLAWVAALAIAKRDAWSGVDEWLIRLVDREVPLKTGVRRQPELGATAAALLAARHQRSAADFGLTRVAADLAGSGLEGYRYNTPERHQEVLRWWHERPKDLSTAPVP